MNPKDNDGSKNAGEPIAIVGLGGCFPDADSVPAYWHNICQNHVAINDVPADRWDPALYFSADRSAPDKTYCRIGGFVRHTRFDARRFRIPPRTLAAIDEVQKMALTAVAEALDDAGLEVFPGVANSHPEKPAKAFDRDRTAVILGNAMGGEAEDRTSMRVWFAEAKQALRISAASCSVPQALQDTLLDSFETEYKSHLPTITEDSMPGELSNCITGRIANAFDLRGPNFTTDAACAASMAALQTAVRGLASGEYDTAIVGGADRSMDPPTYVKFSKIGALSGELSAPFDARASGFVMGEGVGILVLKRLADAEAEGHRVYAVIRGVGAASDGKGKGITAPNPRGQRLAIERAYEEAGVPLGSVGLFEAHGTATTVGDATELGVLTDLLREAGAAPAAVPIGSVKSMIGHLKSAAGAAAVIKAALAVYHKQLPPSANFQQAPAGSPLQDGFLAVNTALRAWPSAHHPRRAGVSAFGFGGTNFHVVLEEYTRVAGDNAGLAVPAPKLEAPVAAAKPSSRAAQIIALFAEKTGYAPAELELAHHLEGDLGIDTVKQAEILGILRQRFGLGADPNFRLADTPTLRHVIDYIDRGAPQPPSSSPVTSTATPVPHVLLFGGASAAAAVAAAQRLLAGPERWSDALAGRHAAAGAAGRLAFYCTTWDEARHKAQEAGKRRAKMLAAQGIYVAEGEPLGRTHKIAFLFPGQGSQYLGMMRDLAERFAEVKQTFEEADAILAPLIHGQLTQIIWPDAADEAADTCLRETQNCQPAMLTADVAMLRLLQAHGVNPAMVAGHSLGEYAAAVCAGVLSFADALYAVSARGREMAGVKVADNGKMAMVACDAARVQAVLDTMDGYIIAANKNCHTQTVIAGETAVVDAAIAQFTQQGIEARQIPVSHAFHSRIVAPAEGPLARVLRGLAIKPPQIPICSNVDASYYPNDAEAIIALMARQLASPVEFIAQIERLYADGARIFVEVGPRRAITGFVRNVLGQRDHRALAANHPKKPGVDAFVELLAALASEGVPVRFAGDAPAAPDVALPSPAFSPQAPQAAADAVDGGAKASAEAAPQAAAVTISGMALALPQARPYGDLHDDLWARLLAGENFIMPLGDAERQAILEHNVVRLDKAEGSFTPLREVAEVIQLASRYGAYDLQADFNLDESLVDALDATGRLAVATGIDALRDAGLPLVRRYRETSTGKRLPGSWALPPQIGRRTGVIVASAFPGLDRILDEAARYAAAQGARRSAHDLSQFVEEWAQTLHDPAEAARLREAYKARAAALQDEAALYTFNRKWLLRSLSLGHAQLAQAILAQGPNTQLNAACASGTQAIGVAQDWIRLGRCDRVVVVSVDDVTGPSTLSWFGAAFLAVGAATVEPDVRHAAVPFGAKRNGMVLGAGAAAFVVEADACVTARGMVPIVDVLACRFGNSAFHGTRLDSQYIRTFLAEAVNDVQTQTGLSQAQLAERLFFMSHETYTPARGGSSAAEIDALRHAFGEATAKVLVANTKGYTGHPMAASLEDAVAIKGLQRQTLPAVANLTDIDPAFADLNFSRGGAITADLALRFAAGFGSQCAVAAYRRRATTEARLAEPARYTAWLQEQTGRAEVGLEVVSRTLRVAESGGQAAWDLGIAALERIVAPSQAPGAALHAPPPAIAETGEAAILAELTQLFAEHTGYDVADLAPSHTLEADLGIDTVKQAEIFGVVRARYQLPTERQFRLSDIPTLERIAQYVASRMPAPSLPQPAKSVVEEASPPAAPADLLQEITQLFATQTGYAASDLDPSHALEGDLGIDTVKQAEIFAMARSRYGLPPDAAFKLADVPTLSAVTAYVQRHRQPTEPPPRPTARPATHAAPPAAVAAAVIDDATVLADIIALFAEHTGYAASELQPDFNLEADLGIDTVKQAEIFAQVRQRFGLASQAQFKLSDVQTLRAIAAYVISSRRQVAPAPQAIAAPEPVAAPPAAPPPQTAAASPAAAPKRAEVVAALVALFAEHTGYDPGDLHVDYALEADLGIDTVKQAEMLALVRRRFHLPPEENFQLSAVQSIAAIADYVLAHTPNPALSPAPTAAAAPARGRFTVQHTALLPVAPPRGRFTVLNKRLVLVGGDAAAKAAFRQALTTQGAQVHAMGWEEAVGSPQRFADLAGQCADVVVCLQQPMPSSADEVQKQQTDLLAVARALGRARRGDMAGAGLLMVGRQAGAFGFHHGRRDALVMAGAAGALKSLAKEWPQARCVAVDMGHAEPWQDTAMRALEAWTSEGPCELVWYQGAWWMPRRQRDAAYESAPLPPRSVVLATGGARGVTYQLLLALAQQGPLRLVILSRTGGVAPAESPLTDRNEAQVKELARAAVTAAGERATPAAIRRWIERQEVRLEVAHNLDALRQAGSEVELIPCDVASHPALAQAMAHVRWRYGSVDVLLHGAGVEESKFLVDKDDLALTRVFAPKATAALHLWESLRPRRMITMGSVAGRFGNAAQADYAAANETLAALARSQQASVLNLAWTAWGDIGMATRGSVKRVLEELGVEIMPAGVGVPLGAGLIASNLSGDVVVSGDMGAFNTSETLNVVSPPKALPKLFDRVIPTPTGAILTRLFNPRQDIGLDDHRIDGVAVLPGVLGVELLAQAAMYVCDAPVHGLRQVRFDSPFKFFRDEPIEARVQARRRDDGGVDLTLTSLFVGPGGRAVERAHFSAQAILAFTPANDDEAPPEALHERAGAVPIGRDAMYERYFHGPSFQVVEAVLRVGTVGADAKPLAAPPAWLHGLEASAFVTAPMWREAGFQTAGLWEMAELGRMALPAAIESLTWPAPPGDDAVVEARRRSTDKDGCVFDVWVRDGSGRVMDLMRGYRTVTLHELAADKRFDAAPASTPAASSLIVRIEEVQALLAKDADAALARYLSPTERSRYDTLVVQKRRLEWLAARIAAKRLIRETCLGGEQESVPYDSITIQRDKLGAPEVEILGGKRPMPRISMSHSDGVAAAFISPRADLRPGIDVERVEARDPTFAQTYFTESEQTEARRHENPDQALTEIWAVKEAMLKALGLGARVDFRDVVALPEADRWVVTLRGGALARANELGTGEPDVHVEATGARVIARVLLPVITEDVRHPKPVAEARV